MAIGSSSPVHAKPRPERRGKVVSLAYFSSDDELVSGLRAGRTDAQAEVFRRFESRVAALLHCLTGTHHDVPELVEEVFARAFVDAKALRGSGGVLEPWLVRQAVNTASSVLRRRVVRRFFGSAWRMRRRSNLRRLPRAAAIANGAQFEAVGRFYAVADRLRVSQRVALLLEIVDGMSVPEIAEACASSTAQVRRRLQRAKARFESLVDCDGLLHALRGGTV